MNEEELLKEKFKSAVASAVKAISENFKIEIEFGNNNSSKKNTLNLPEIVNLKKMQDFTNLRAFADSEALKMKYTDNKIYTKNEPQGAMAKSLYAIAEKIRYEKIGSDKLKGVRNNITQCYENKFKGKKIEEIKTENDVPITEAFELYLRSHFFNIKKNNNTKKILSYWQELFDKNLKSKLNELDICVKDQDKFNQTIAKLINNLEFDDSDSKEKEEKQDTKEDESSAQNNNEQEDTANNDTNEKEENELNVTENNYESLDENNDQNQMILMK